MKADFSQIVRESIQITKRNKRLWVFGIVLASLSFGSGLNYLGNSNQSDSTKTPPHYANDAGENLAPTIVNQSKALGLPNLGELAETTFKSIPPHVYAIGFLGLLTIALLAISIGIYAKSWATVGLVHGIELESSKTYATLYELSDYAKKHTTELAKLYIIPNLILGLVAFVTIILGTILMAVGQSETASIMLILVYVLIALIVFLIAMMIQGAINLGVMTLVLEHLSWKKSLAKGWKVFRKFWLEVSVMYFINCMLGCLVVMGMGIIMAIVGSIVALPLLLGESAKSAVLITMIPFLVLGIPAFILTTFVIRTFMTVFNQATWVLLYKQLVSTLQPPIPATMEAKPEGDAHHD